MPDSPVPSVFGYNAEATDYSTGLQYLRARYYDTTVQRFVQEDDYRGRFTRPSSLNRYVYTEGNPVTNIDPSGYALSKTIEQKILTGEKNKDIYKLPPIVKPSEKLKYGLTDTGSGMTSQDHRLAEMLEQRQKDEQEIQDKIAAEKAEAEAFTPIEGGIQTPNGVLYPDGTFVDNDGNITYCGTNAYDSIDLNIIPLESSFPEGFIKLYNEKVNLEKVIYSMTQKVIENTNRITELKAEIEIQKDNRSAIEIDIDPLNIAIAIGYSVLTVEAVLVAMATFEVGVGIALAFVDVYLIADTIDAWISATYQPERANITKKIKDIKEEINNLVYDKLSLWNEKKYNLGEIQKAEKELKNKEEELERYYPGMAETYENYRSKNENLIFAPAN